jgi:hypothetical protein
MIALVNMYDYGVGKRAEHNGSRHYITDRGHKVPSVTTILGKTKDMTHLNEWRNRVGHAAANQISRESADLGTLMHTHLEKYILGQDRPGGTNVGRMLAQQMADVIIHQGLSNVQEVWGIESPLWFETFWAGTTDCVGVHGQIPSIMDFKTTNKMKKREWIEDYFLQLVAYAMAHNHRFNTNIQRGVIFMASRNLEYGEFVIEGDEFEHYKSLWCQRVAQYYTNTIYPTQPS